MSRYTGVEKDPQAILESFCPACDHEHQPLSWHQLLWTPQAKVCWVSTHGNERVLSGKPSMNQLCR